MTEQPGREGEDADRGGEPGERWMPAPRWVRVSVVIAGLVVLLLLVLFLVGDDHGPARHLT